MAESKMAEEPEIRKTEKKAKKKEQKSFEEALARLNEIVALLENGTAPLDTSLSLYEEGIALVRFCSEKLDDAERQVKVLTRGTDGEIIEKDFAPLETPLS